MINVNKLFCIIILLISTLCIGKIIANDPLKDAIQVAQKVKATNGEVVSCDPSLFNDSISIPLSFFCENFEVVKLESSDEADVVPAPAIISDNYILVESAARRPFKLFDRKTGKFITDIGEYGVGPDKYGRIYHYQLDEENDRIYVLPWISKQILVYNLKGELQPAIPLRLASPKGTFKVNFADKKVAVVILPFGELQAMAWEQTFEGKIIKWIAPGHLSIPPEFEYEVSTTHAVDALDLFIFSTTPKIDTLYHYNMLENKLVPQFTFDFKEGDVPTHFFSQTKDYFIGETVVPKKENDTLVTEEPVNRFFIIDKASLKGSYFFVVNDFLGDMRVEWPVYNMSRGYYILNIAPEDLREKLEETLTENNEMSAEMREKMETLKNSITEKDNSYIIYGKLKI